ncbi:MAG: hypothetical protein J0M18_02470 [Ignavibacteria bacterium]|jgi:hypothetical protein|nr:hypothetical protein [Ignavibacteria bacterium]
MNKILLLLFPVLFLSFYSQSFSQREDDIFFQRNGFIDANLSLLGPCDIKYYYLKSNDMLVIKSKSDAMRFIDSTNSSYPVSFNDIDFNKNTLVLFSYHGGDCHAKFKYYSVNDEYSKKFTICVDIIYGGCRAGGKFMTTWGLIPKLPEDYKLGFNTYFVDRD